MLKILQCLSYQLRIKVMAFSDTSALAARVPILSADTCDQPLSPVSKFLYNYFLGKLALTFKLIMPFAP